MEERERYSNGLEVRRAVLGDAHVDRALSRLAAKFEAVIVIAKLEAGCAALHSSLVHFVREQFKVLEIAALRGLKVRHHHVPDAELLRVFDGLFPGCA